MALLRFGRVPSRPLSLWQSAVAEFARQQLQGTNSNVSQTMVMQHPMVSAAAEQEGYEQRAPGELWGRGLFCQSVLQPVADYLLEQDLWEYLPDDEGRCQLLLATADACPGEAVTGWGECCAA
jgi:hypothetical protein